MVDNMYIYVQQQENVIHILIFKSLRIIICETKKTRVEPLNNVHSV